MSRDIGFIQTVEMVRKVVASGHDPELVLPSISNELSDADVQREFFRGIADVSWLRPLRTNGYFDKPPSRMTTPEGAVRHPTWPAMNYLVRMAPHAPSEVASILISIKSDNWSVVRSGVDAVKALPADYAVNLVPKLIEWSKSDLLWHDLSDLAEICAKLATVDHANAAMQLLKATFALDWSLDNRNRRDEHWYINELKERLIPALIPIRARELIEHLVTELIRAMTADAYLGKLNSNESYEIARPAIEDHRQNSDYNISSKLIGCLRIAVEQAIIERCLQIDEVMQLLTPVPSKLRERFRLHLINEFADAAPDVARQGIMSNESLETNGIKHEYARLVADRFGLLVEAERTEWFARVQRGPDMMRWERIHEKHYGRSGTDEERREYAEYWKYIRLHWVRQHLPDELRQRYEMLAKEFGEPRFADMDVHHGTRSGSTSPFSDEELSKLTFEQVIDIVSNWKEGPSTFDAPDLEGLTNAFGKYVASRIEEAASNALQLKGRSANFVRAFISQVAEAVKQRKQLLLLPVLDLCEWVVGRDINERTTPQRTVDGMLDTSWQWSRDEISRLLELICEARISEGSKKPSYSLDEFRKPIWSLLLKLIESPTRYSDMEDEIETDPRIKDFNSMAINSPRGKAMQAVIEYARWIALHKMDVTDGKEILRDKFDTMPEVRQLIAKQIDPTNSSFEVMSILGSHFGLLLWIDDQWFEANAQRICDLKPVEQNPASAHGWAAWNTFLVWGQPHRVFLRIFRSQYEYSVALGKTITLPETARMEPFSRLGEHLAILYGRGDLPLDEAGSLIRTMIDEWPSSIRVHVMTFVGWTLEEQKKEIPKDVVERFAALWDYYWSSIGEKDARDNKESRTFGSWFSSGVFDPKWSLDRLEAFTTIVPTPEPDHSIVGQLGKIADIDILQTVRILEKLVEGDKDGWRVAHWEKHAYQILKKAMADSSNAKKLAEQVIDKLGRRGFMKFGELLNLSRAEKGTFFFDT